MTLIGDRWLNANAVVSLPGYGSSAYRIGSRQLPTYALPSFFELDEPNTTGLDVQVGLPLVDPASEDQLGNRYYAVVLAARPAGPADVIADVTREQVVQDYKSVEAYKLLTERIEEFKAAIASNGSLAPAIDLATAISGDPESANRPGVIRNILVRRDSIDRGSLAAFVDQSLNTEAFRNAVLEAASALDPLASPEAVAANPIPVVVALPASRSVAVSLVIAPRPVTIERFRSIARAVISSTAQRELVDAGLGTDDPFSFEALSARYGLVRLDTEDEDGDFKGQAGDGSEQASSDKPAEG